MVNRSNKQHNKLDGTPHPDVEKQHVWLTEYRLNPIHVGALCDQYPGLMIAWNQFKTTYEMCNSNEINKQVP